MQVSRTTSSFSHTLITLSRIADATGRRRDASDVQTRDNGFRCCSRPPPSPLHLQQNQHYDMFCAFLTLRRRVQSRIFCTYASQILQADEPCLALHLHTRWNTKRLPANIEALPEPHVQVERSLRLQDSQFVRSLLLPACPLKDSRQQLCKAS
ncbi:hypothetical protein N658DRAFT_40422 [Parathielavia hyrcaniae]|uniref:Uncharacterized protein n=1 Tax=Parathielavia hyrcaniae TaxID=113614 RepID=A0AAN6T2P3_9PEZI|nr:hypothetical protein N658DRAFT_40422 [Parathielavia hyrcaniae]